MSEPKASVWKYELEPGVTVLELPDGAMPLTVAAVGDSVYLWALVIAERDSRSGPGPIPTRPRAFLTLGTGHHAHPAVIGRHVGTAFMHGGLFVWHVFETAVP